MRRYFITGGTGFIGRALVRHLLKLPDTDRIVCLTRGRPDLIEHRKVAYWKGDITDVAFPASSKFTDLIHAAAEANDLLQPDQPKYYYDLVEGARRVFEWAADSSLRVLFVSSGVVRKGDTTYCRAKRMSEWLCERYPIAPKIARVFSVVGEEMPLNGQYALGRFIHGAVNGCVSYYGGGSIRSYLHVEDVVQWLMAVLDKGMEGHPYDVGALRPISISDLALLVGRIAGVPVKETQTTDFRAANIYLPNAVDTKAKLHVRETVSLEESIGRVLDHVRNTRVQAA